MKIPGAIPCATADFAYDTNPGGPLDANSSDQFKVESANQMAAMLAEWDNKVALPVLKARVRRCARVVRDGQERGTRFHGMEAGIASLTNLRTQAGDSAALNDYAGWVRTLTPDHFTFFPIAMFEPLWHNPDNPAMIDAATALFEDPKSPWNPRVWRGDATVNRGTLYCHGAGAAGGGHWQRLEWVGRRCVEHAFSARRQSRTDGGHSAAADVEVGVRIRRRHLRALAASGCGRPPVRRQRKR